MIQGCSGLPFLLVWLWVVCVSFNKLVYLISVIKFMGIYSFINIFMSRGSVVKTFLSRMILVIRVCVTLSDSLFCLRGQGVIDFIDIFKVLEFSFVDFSIIFLFLNSSISALIYTISYLLLVLGLNSFSFSGSPR